LTRPASEAAGSVKKEAKNACFEKHLGELNFDRQDSLAKAVARVVSNAAAGSKTGELNAIVSHDISPDALECFQKAASVSVCDFSNLRNIDRLVKRDTALIYFEVPSFEKFRVYDFEDIKRFAESFGIKTCIGFSFTDPYCANTREILRPDHIIQFPSSYFLAETKTAGWAVLTKNESGAADEGKAGRKENDENEIKNAEDIKQFEFHINRSFSNARRLYSILKKSSKIKHLEVIYTEKSDHADYKIIRRALRESGCFVRVNGASEEISDFCRLLASFFGGSNINFYEYLNLEEISRRCGLPESCAIRLKNSEAGRESILFKTGSHEMEDQLKILSGMLS